MKADYKKDIGQLFITSRNKHKEIDNDTINQAISLKRKYGVKTKYYPENEEVLSIFIKVLNEGCKSRKAAEWFAKENNKPDEWVKDILDLKGKTYISYCIELLESEGNDVLSRMKKNKMLPKRDILKCKISGALNKIRALMKISDDIDSLRSRINELENILKTRPEKRSTWKEQAVILREEGKTVREIANELGVAKSTVQDFFKRCE